MIQVFFASAKILSQNLSLKKEDYMLESALIIYRLLIQLAIGIALATQFAPGARKFMRNQTFLALAFLTLAPLVSLCFSPELGIKRDSIWSVRELYCIAALGVGLICAAWLRYEPGHATFEAIVNWALTILGVCLLFAMSKIYGISESGWQLNASFFLNLASALLLGSIWTAMAYTREDFRSQTKVSAPVVFGRLLFLAVSGIVLVAIFTPLAQNLAHMPDAAAWNAWHGGLSGFATLTFLVAVYQSWPGRDKSLRQEPNAVLPGMPAMAFAFILALLGEACGLAATLLTN